jgi:uncharacterized protein (DUF2147 family)
VIRREPDVTLAKASHSRNLAAISHGEETQMKLPILATLMVLGAGAAFAADPLEGNWKTEVDDGAYAIVKIAPCGAALCGIISQTFNDTGEYESENKGKKIVIDMISQGGNAYEGSIWRPSNDKVYYGTIALNGSNLKLAGCVLGGLICSKQSWTRVQ